MAQLATIKQMSMQVSRGSAGDYQADDQAGVTAEVEIIRQMSWQVSSSSTGDYQVEEQAGVTRLSCLLSSR